MHLLNTITKELKTFYGEKIPKYAILSHMWGGEGDEVLFRHIAGSDADKIEGKDRKGYAKLEGACKKAKEDGWDYIWIDTCCIDKTSSAELSEAINSMFEWYWKSEVCYVYLEDVVSGEDGQAESNEDTRFPIVPFERSRWFTRGWTLQELIAPQIVVFYSRDWVDIGTKESLRNTISGVTRIRVEMLLEYDPEKASVAEKISWAAFRETTRAEDAAYCLMGLLGVNMPLLYGEGDRAFRRLQEEFMKVSDDDSLFAWKSHLDNYSDCLKDSRGMLANSPWEFRDGAIIERSKDGAYSPYSMTNQGLQINLPLLPIDHQLNIDSENTFKTILKCTTRNESKHWPSTQRIVIYLKKIREGCYQRIFSHWLDETKTSPDGTEPIMLLVPQADTRMTRDRSRIRDIKNRSRIWGRTWNIEVEILPTVSGYTVNGHTLVEGYSFDLDFRTYDKVVFKYKKKSFGVAIGFDKGIPWLDFIGVIVEEPTWFRRSRSDYLYEEGSSHAHIRKCHLNRLSEKIPGEDLWLTVLVKRINDIQRGPCFRAVIDIQRDRTWYIPPRILVSDGFSGDFLDNHEHLHLDHKKGSYDWVALFNPKVKQVLDVNLVYRHTIPRVDGREIDDIQFSSDGKYFATCSKPGGTIRVYDIRTSAIIFEEFKEATIYSMCFSPDGKFVATGYSEGYIDIWDIGTERIHKSLFCNKTADSLCFSFDGHLLFTGLGRAVQIWEIDNDTSKILTDYIADITSIAVSPNNRLVTAGSSDGIIRIWDIATTRVLEELWENEDDFKFDLGVDSVAFTPDGKGLVSGSRNGTVKYRDTSRLVPTEVKTEFGELSDSGVSNMDGMTFIGHKERVTSVTVSHDGRWLISGSEDGCVLVWDLSDATPQFILKIQKSWISPFSIKMSRLAGNTFVTFQKGNDTFRVWRYTNKI